MSGTGCPCCDYYSCSPGTVSHDLHEALVISILSEQLVVYPQVYCTILSVPGALPRKGVSRMGRLSEHQVSGNGDQEY